MTTAYLGNEEVVLLILAGVGAQYQLLFGVLVGFLLALQQPGCQQAGIPSIHRGADTVRWTGELCCRCKHRPSGGPSKLQNRSACICVQIAFGGPSLVESV